MDYTPNPESFSNLNTRLKLATAPQDQQFLSISDYTTPRKHTFNAHVRTETTPIIYGPHGEVANADRVSASRVRLDMHHGASAFNTSFFDGTSGYTFDQTFEIVNTMDQAYNITQEPIVFGGFSTMTVNGTTVFSRVGMAVDQAILWSDYQVAVDHKHPQASTIYTSSFGVFAYSPTPELTITANSGYAAGYAMPWPTGGGLVILWFKAIQTIGDAMQLANDPHRQPRQQSLEGHKPKSIGWWLHQLDSELGASTNRQLELPN